MEDNPYMTLVKAMRGKPQGASLMLGQVLTAPTELARDVPLKVLAGGNAMEREALLKNAALEPFLLAAGDTVLLLPIEDAQRYLVICKVVEA